MANGKWQMENHLKFAICRLPFDLLVFKIASRDWLDTRGMENSELPQPPAPSLTPDTCFSSSTSQ
jgi:hypothetical protein